MKRSLLSLFLTLAAMTAASAQAGWDTPAPTKAPAQKATTTKAAASGGQNRATGNEKAPQNDGRTVSPYPSASAQPDANPGNTASTPLGTTSGQTQGGSDHQGMSVAPGTPVMLQSGRNVLANDAAAARERRMNRMNKLNKVPAVPTLAGADAPAPAAAAPAPADAVGAAGTSNAGGMGATGTAGATKSTSTKATKTSKPAKRPAPAPAGW